jgi:hypothetical protein
MISMIILSGIAGGIYKTFLLLGNCGWKPLPHLTPYLGATLWERLPAAINEMDRYQ